MRDWYQRPELARLSPESRDSLLWGRHLGRAGSTFAYALLLLTCRPARKMDCS